MSKVVSGEGPRNAKLVLIGEALGAEELRLTRPFVGQAGQKLDKWLGQVGIERKGCFLDNVMQVRPSGNKFEPAFYEKGHVPTRELEEGRARLIATLEEIKPNVIVAFGNEPLEALTGKRGILNWRGSILPTNLGKVIPILHPAAALRQFKWGVLCLRDLKRAKEESESPFYQEPFQWSNLQIIDTPSEAVAALRQASQAKYAVIDLETVMYTKLVTHFGVCCDPNSAFSIPLCERNGEPLYGKGDERRIWLAIDDFCRSESRKIVQNAVFDLPVLGEWGVHVNNFWFDTLVGSHAAYPELPRGLSSLTSLYTKIPYYYGLKESGFRDYCYYNALDCLATYRVAMHLVHTELPLVGTSRLYFRTVHPALRVAIKMQERGLCCDVEWREKEADRLDTIRGELQGKLDTLVGHSLNINSRTQMPTWLYDEMKLPKQYHPKTKRVTTDEAALTRLMKKYQRPEFEVIIKLRYLTKLLGTYYRGALDADKRIRCSWDVAGTVTGRWSSSKTAQETGMDLQNIPTSEREMVVPDKGLTFIYADLAQADARVVAWLSKDPALLKAFREGKKIHTIVAAGIFGVPESEITPTQYFAGKVAGHASNYKTGPRTFASEVEKNTINRLLKLSCRDPSIKIDMKASRPSEAECKRQQNAYYLRFYKIPIWHGEVEREVRGKRKLVTPMGRVRYFFDRMNDSSVRQAINFKPQSAVADVINQIVARVDAVLPPGCELLLQNHDAILTQQPQELEETIKTIIQNAAQIVMLGDLIIPIEVKTGNNWKELE